MNNMHSQTLKKNIVNKILGDKTRTPQKSVGQAFAPANIALCKYWGKRDLILNLPMTNSLSISLNEEGARTKISLWEAPKADTHDKIILNTELVHPDKPFSKALSLYLDFFRTHEEMRFQIETDVDIPIAAGLASSACGFAALVKSLNDLYAWELEPHKLSILARLGSGSASRSLWDGFVEWERGCCVEGLDSYGVPLTVQWPELRIGLLILETKQKNISSRVAMENTLNTSPFYRIWPEVVEQDLCVLKSAILKRDFNTLGTVSEANAQAMHALMMTARPSILYSTPETLKAQNQIGMCRQEGLSVYFTQDAGPNLKLLFLEKDLNAVKDIFPALKVVAPFERFL